MPVTATCSDSYVDAKSTEPLAKLSGALEQQPVTEFLELLSTAESLRVAWLRLGTVREFF